ncbi:MAG: hypothetical protein ACOX6G_00400 [Christensenellales bacterium]|jgi:hypothetical protein|nr:hypothetical protein [Clostridiales bacterium]
MLIESIIHYIYIALAGIFGIMLLVKVFKREKRQGIVYDIVYAYCCVPFLMRLLGIK